MEVCMNPIETRGGSIGWDPKVERAFDGILEHCDSLIKTCQVGDANDRWSTAEELLDSYSKSDLVEDLSKDQILELLECFEDYYEQCKKEGRKVFD
jgi:predicted YcjX-like family ATPase